MVTRARERGKQVTKQRFREPGKTFQVVTFTKAKRNKQMQLILMVGFSEANISQISLQHVINTKKIDI